MVQSLATTLLARRRILKRVITPTGPGWEPTEDAADVLAYYANSIRHHFHATSGG